MATVRTQAGSERFKQPIGTSILDAPPEPPAPQPRVSAVRLRSLRALIEQKQAAGDGGAVRALSEKFRAEFALFSKGMTPEEAEAALSDADAE